MSTFIIIIDWDIPNVQTAHSNFANRLGVYRMKRSNIILT